MSWKEIADYLGRDVRTVVRWEKDKGLPVHRVPGGKRQAVYAFSDELDRWLRGEAEAAGQDSLLPVTVIEAPAATQQRRVRHAEWALLIAVALICFSLLGFLFRPQTQGNEPLRLLKLNTQAGIVGMAALSPDGRQVAYTFRRTGEITWHIYVQLIGAGDPVRVTRGDEQEGHPAWSPDGRFLAFFAGTPDSGSLVIAPALGGTPRVVARIREPHAATYVTWSPDGKGLVYPDRDSESDPVSTYNLRIDTGERSLIFTAPDTFTRDFGGAFSPDGKFFAFVRSGDNYRGQLLLVPSSGGDPRKLADAAGGTLSWTADSREIVYQSLIAGQNRADLLRVAIAGGEPRLVTTSVFNLASPSVARSGKGMVFLQHQNDANIWRLELGKTGVKRSIVADSQERDVDPACSPDGKRLVFLSYRNGPDLWLADADGSTHRLTYTADSDAKNSGTPDWSPDQRAVAFSVFRGIKTDISVVDLASGDMRPLVTHPANDGFPRWSRDGRSIYFTSDRSGRYEIWRMNADGSTQIQVTQNGGYVGQESPDGKYLYFGKQYTEGLWRMPIAGGAEELFVPQLSRRYAWTISDSGIFFINGITFPGLAVHFYDFSTGRISHIYEPLEALEYGPAKMSACRDGKTLYISQSDVTRSDLIWAENFR